CVCSFRGKRGDFLTSDLCTVSTLCCGRESIPTHEGLKSQKTFYHGTCILHCRLPQACCEGLRDGKRIQKRAHDAGALRSFVSTSRMYRSLIAFVGLESSGQWESI